MTRPRADRARPRALIAAFVLCSCGAPVEGATTPTPGATRLVRLAPPGSRLTVRAPAATRVAHTLRYRAGPLELRFADAMVAEGRERTMAEAYLGELERRHGGEVRHRPFAQGGAEGLSVTLTTERSRVRVLTLWRDGAVSRLSVVGAPEHAALAERVLDTLRFDPSQPLDPRAAMQLDADPIEGLPLLRVSTERLLFREEGHAVPFPSAEAALDVTYIPFEGERPDERARGRLLGARFRGLPLETPQLAPLEDTLIGGFTMTSRATIGGTEIALFGAYLELEGGSVLVRASVETARAEVWVPRFIALTRSLRPR